MSHLRQARTRSRWASDHERARSLAAERLSERLSADDAAWLERHLADCVECRTIADAYAAEALELHSLPTPEPPRDLWARTSAALDAEERRAGRARRTVGRRPPRPFGTAPLGAFAGAMVVVLVVGAALLADRGLFAPVLPGPGTQATPLIVQPQDVAWLAPQQDGTYALNFASLDRVCPASAAPDCAPIDASARKVITLSSAPRAVLRSPAKSQFVVVDAATTSVGGTVYVVPVGSAGQPSPSGTSPTPLLIASATPEPTSEFTFQSVAPGGSSAGGSASASPSASPTIVVDHNSVPSSATPGATGREESPVATERPSPSTEPSPSGTQAASPSAGEVSPSPLGSPEATGSPAASPQGPSEPIAIISDVVVVGETAAYSADGSWFAFTARPADSSQGPDIYVWHSGDDSARPVTFDHDSIFSSWLGDEILGSRPAAPDLVFEPTPTPTPSASASPTSSGTSESPAGASGSPAASPSASGPIGDAPPAGASSSASAPSSVGNRASHAPAASVPVASSTPQDGDESPSPSVSPEASPSPSSSPEASPASGPQVARPVSFVIDPATDSETDLLGAPGWRPVVDPTGRWVVYWSGSIAYDAASRTWNPADGSLVVAPFATLAGSAAAVVLPSPTAETTPSPSGSESSSPLTQGASDGLPTASDGTGTAAASDLSSPSPTPSPAESADASRAPGSDVGSSPSGSPFAPGESSGSSESLSESPNPSPLPPITGPEPLLPVIPNASTAAPLHDWDVRFDPTGAHVAVWTADQLDPDVGRLSLLSFDPATGRVDPSSSLLIDQPALVGYSIDSGRLAWATPPGQDGQGSRLQVLAWQGDGSGLLTSESATGEDAVVVVR